MGNGKIFSRNIKGYDGIQQKTEKPAGRKSIDIIPFHAKMFGMVCVCFQKNL
jgi:hypothetical protein